MNNQTVFMKIVVIVICSLLMMSCAREMGVGKPDASETEVDELDAEAYYLQGNDSFDAGQYEKAIADYTQAIELDPTYAVTYYNRGLAYYKAGHSDEKAIADYTKAIELDPNYANAYKNRAIMFYEAGKCDEAWKDVRQAQDLGAQIHPGFLEALGQQCPPKSADSQGKMSPQEAIQRLKEEWGYSEITEGAFVMSAVREPKEVAELFLAAGLPVDSKNQDGETPLYMAVTFQNDDVALLLIEKGADVNVTDVVGASVLHRAVSNCDSTKVVQALVDAGADVHATPDGGATAYQIAGFSNCTAIQEILKKAGAK